MPCASPGSFSNYVEDSFLKHLLGIAPWTPPANLYAALGTAPTDTGITELSGKGYKRIKVTFDGLATDTNGFSSVKNNSCIRFGPAGEDWSAINVLGLFDSVTSGNFITWAPFLTNWTVKADESLVIAPGDLEPGITEYSSLSRWTQYLQENTLAHVYLGQSFTPPSMYAAIMHSLPGYNPSNTSLGEPSDSAYSRPLIATWNDPVQGVTGEATCSNKDGGDFGTATEDWFPSSNQQEGVAFCDTGDKSSSTGNVLMFCKTSVAQTILDGNTVGILANGNLIKVGLQ